MYHLKDAEYGAYDLGEERTPMNASPDSERMATGADNLVLTYHLYYRYDRD